MRIFIFGKSGSGKTTLAKKLSSNLRHLVYDLDDIMFIEKYSKLRDKEERKKLVIKIAKKKDWIIEGSQTGYWTEPALTRANYFIYIRCTNFKAISRVIIRYFKRKIKGHKGETLKGIYGLINYILDMENPNKRFFKENEERLKKFKGEKIIFKEKDLEKLIQNLKNIK